MPNAKKVEDVAEFKAEVQSHMLSVATQYQGITVEQVTDLRRRFRAEGIKFKVYKNTLAKRALDELGLSGAAAFMSGPTAWAFGNDPVAPSKILKEVAKGVKVLVTNGGVLEGRVITKAQVESLAMMPPRDVLIAQVVGTIAMPLRNLVGALSALPRNLVNVLDQVRKQKEEATAA